MATISKETEKQLETVCTTIRGRRKTRENKRRFLKNYFTANCNATAAAAITGIGRRTIYAWRADDTAFVDAMQQVEALFQSHLTGLVVDEAEQGNDRLIALAARKLVPEFSDGPQVAINNVAIVNPNRSHEERMARTAEIMRILGYTVTKDNLDKVVEGIAHAQVTDKSYGEITTKAQNEKRHSGVRIDAPIL